MTRDEYLEALLPAARQSIVHFVGAEKERRARAMLDQLSTSELAIRYGNQVATGAIKPTTPVVTAQDVEAERIKGEQELQKLRDQLEMDQAMAEEARIMDEEKFREQQFDQQAPQRAAQLAKDRQTFSESARLLRKFAVNEANFLLTRSVLGPGFSYYELNDALLSNAITLTPPTAAEFSDWHQHDIDAHNRSVLSADPDQLRLRVREEAEQKRITQQQQEQAAALAAQQSRDAHLGFPKLPDTWQGQPLDAGFLRRCDAATQRLISRKFGSAQVTERLLQGKG